MRASSQELANVLKAVKNSILCGDQDLVVGMINKNIMTLIKETIGNDIAFNKKEFEQIQNYFIEVLFDLENKNEH